VKNCVAIALARVLAGLVQLAIRPAAALALIGAVFLVH